MPMLPRTLFRWLLLAALLTPATALHARSSTEQRRAEIRAMRDEVLTELYRLNPRAKERIRRAAGYAVFSNVGINLVFASFAGGRGIVVEDGTFSDTETFMKMGSAGIGLGLGVKDFRAVFVFETRESLRNFITKGWDFSGQADAAAKSDKKGDALGASESFIPEVSVYQITKNGIALQATLQGTKFWRDKDLN